MSLYVCLSAGSSLVALLPWLIVGSTLKATNAQQLATYPLRQVKNPQTGTLKRLGDLGSDDGGSLQVWVRNSRSTCPWTPNDL